MEQGNSIIVGTKCEVVNSRKIILNEMIDLIETLFKEMTNPSKRSWEDQIEFEAGISNRINVLRDEVGKI